MDLADRLDPDGADRARGDDRPEPSVLALPDGSVDRIYRVAGRDGERLRRREELADALAGGRTAAVELQRVATEPGGHAVNAAEQADALGDDVGLVGTLDDPVFADCPFPTASTGAPSRVAVYEFEDGAALAVEPSDDHARWSLAALERATGEDPASLCSTDAVCWTNWTTVEGVPAALSELARRGASGGWFCFDPGAVAARSPPEVDALFEALARLGSGFRVVLAANREEVHHLASALRIARFGGRSGEPAGDGGDSSSDGGESTGEDLSDERALLRLAAAGDLAAAVLHEADVALAATPGGIARAEPPEVDPARHVGGGDRFDAGLVHALLRDWPWTDALALANACASHYVATGRSATRSELADFVREHASRPARSTVPG